MAKKITRTITVYTYVTGKFDVSAMTVTNMHKHEFPYKLGQRERRKLEKLVNAPIIAEETSERTYAMSIEDFIHYATPVDGEAADDEESEESEADETGESDNG